MTPRPRLIPRHGWGLLVPVMTLCAVGVLTIHATSAGQGTSSISAAALRQTAYVVAGLVGMVVALAVGYHRLGRLAYPLLAVCIVLLACLILDRWVDVPLIRPHPSTHARRWIYPGPVPIQPSEPAKIAYVLALAWYLRYRRNYRTLGGLIIPFALTLVPMILIKMEPDLGTALLFLPVLFAVLYAAGAKGKHLAVIMLLGLLSLPLMWAKLASYQQLRLTGVLLQSDWLRTRLQERAERWVRLEPENPQASKWRSQLVNWESGPGYQLVRSKIAIGSGGPYGQGWGQGIFVEYDFLPEKHNDFIFAIIAHQWGIGGGLVVLACYVIIVALGFDLATLTQDPFGRLVAVGFSSLIAVQALTNLCMTVGLGPVTGVTLPFVSAGGSSLVASFVLIGLLISVGRYRPRLLAKPPFEFVEEAEKYGPASG